MFCSQGNTNITLSLFYQSGALQAIGNCHFIRIIFVFRYLKDLPRQLLKIVIFRFGYLLILNSRYFINCFICNHYLMITFFRHFKVI